MHEKALTEKTLTPLAVAALAALAERPMHPYEMYQLAVTRRDHRLVKLRPGTLYHAVARMAEHGLVRVAGTEREGNRPERTTYEITDAGRSALRTSVTDMLGAPTDEYPVFPFALSEAHNLPTDQVADLLRARRASIGSLLTELDRSIDELTAKGVPWAYWLHAGFLRSTYIAEAEWLDGALTDIDTGRFDTRARPEQRENV